MSFNVFIDTEFSDFLDPQLISIGLVAQTGEEFYAELPYDVRACSAFVKEAVLPLLGYAPHAEMSKDILCGELTNWLRLIRPTGQEIFICYEFHQQNKLPEHHALNDARANCYAFQELPPTAG